MENENADSRIEARNLLVRARSEILRQRRQIEVLDARNEVLEIFATALGMRRHSQAMEIDLAWEIQERINADIAAMPLEDEAKDSV